MRLEAGAGLEFKVKKIAWWIQKSIDVPEGEQGHYPKHDVASVLPPRFDSSKQGADGRIKMFVG
jgi:hypothetical protein